MCESLVKDLFQELSEENTRLLNELSFERQLNDILIEVKNYSLIARAQCKCRENRDLFQKINRLSNDFKTMKYSSRPQQQRVLFTTKAGNGSSHQSHSNCTPNGHHNHSYGNGSGGGGMGGANGYHTYNPGHSYMNGMIGLQSCDTNSMSRKSEYRMSDTYSESHTYPQFTLHIKEEIMDDNNGFELKYEPKSDDNMCRSNGQIQMNGFYDTTPADEPKVIPICVECYECFETERELEMHMNGVHQRLKRNSVHNNVFVCDECLPHRVFTTADQMSAHLQRKHGSTNGGNGQPVNLLANGRPFSNGHQMNSQLMSDTMKRKRGRPKKLMSSVGIGYQPLKINGQVGRPRSLDTSVSAPVKRKVGRPPSVDSKPSMFSAKLGRPGSLDANSFVMKGKVGRPSSTDTKLAVNNNKFAKPAGVQPIKGRVGRPPSVDSKANQSKIQTNTFSADTKPKPVVFKGKMKLSIAHKPGVVVKRKVGRPKKLVPKALRGRPPKKLLVNTITESNGSPPKVGNGLRTSPTLKSSPEATDSMNNKAKSPQNTTNMKTEISEKFRQLLDKHKRKRGRPAKQRPVGPIAANVVTATHTSNINNRFPTIADKFKQIMDRHKRGRGRPPKPKIIIDL